MSGPRPGTDQHRGEGRPTAEPPPAKASLERFVELTQLTQVMTALGCPAEKSAAMAAQLDKRAQQLAAETGRSYEEAMTHLLTLLRQGWAAKEKGL